MNSIHQLHGLGQSLWYDNIQRRLLENGELANMVQHGEILGITSNPSIFHNAISKSTDYDSALKPMAWAGWKAEPIFYQLAVEDIRAACDLFLPVYEKTNKANGYVSLEVSPSLAHNSEGTVQDALRLWKWVNRPNLMIKIPATKEGLPAVRQVIAAGVNVNVTLIFSLERYAEVIDAYFQGLEDRISKNLPVDNIASVASFFVSRVDTKVDGRLQAIVNQKDARSAKASSLFGKAAIANARLAYALFKEQINTERFKNLKKHGARLQRPLWASTSTKNPAYRDVIYVEDLIAPDTVNTVPPQTLVAFSDHGNAGLTLEGKEKEASLVFQELESLGISIQNVTQELEVEGVKAFSDAFTALLKTIDERCTEARKELGVLQNAVSARVEKLEIEKAAQQIFDHNPAFWTTDPAGQAEVKKRLGWLDAPRCDPQLLQQIDQVASACQYDGYTKALLLGMGGSSLAPEVLSLTFGVREENGHMGMEFAILDSTDPDQVRAAARQFPPQQTLYIVSSKSGGTAEVSSALEYFWASAVRRLGKRAPDHFIAITDPGTSLEKLARERSFRHVFQADPNVGGRYSALTAFGLVPAFLMGLDVNRLLKNALQVAEQCSPAYPAGRNPGLVLGSIMGEAALQGKDKLSILTDPQLSAFGSWMEQLIAESSGKQGKGIVPVDIEPLAPAKSYPTDRVFVYIRMDGSLDQQAVKLQKAGHPVLILPVKDEYEISAEFFRWEFATAVACGILGVNAFDQPDVQDNKTRTQQKISIFQQKQTLEEGEPVWQNEEAIVYGYKFPGLETCSTIQDVLDTFIKVVKPGDYLAINAYLPRNIRTLIRLQKLRARLQKATKSATTLGFGPRFLHSTGQLHKGGANNGVFLQITAEPQQDIAIPGQGITFGTLEKAQAVGDLEALLARSRRAIRIHLKNKENIKLLK